MFAIETLDHGVGQLESVFFDRTIRHQREYADEVLIGPVGLFLIRQDGSKGSVFAQEVVASFGYWKDMTARYFDGLFLGWGFDGGEVFFNGDKFTACVKELENLLEWTDDGGSHVIITNFEYDPKLQKGAFDFSQCIPLNLTRLMDKKDWKQLSELVMSGLLAPARAGSKSATWEISDYILMLKLRQGIWAQLIDKFASTLGIVDSLKDYAVRDMRRLKD